MSNKWSTYMQTPEFLDATRLVMLDTDMLPVICKWIGLKPGMRVLDVGCGTGALTFYLAQAVSECEFVGLDIDETFIATANQKVKEAECNKFTFVTGDALAMPFEADSFDLVVSHTFFTNAPQPLNTLREMKRIGKPLSIIASMTTQSFEIFPYHTGLYPESHRHYYAEWADMEVKAYEMYEKLMPRKDFLIGVKPEEIPQLFVKGKLWNICMHPIGKGFSLSDASISDDVKKQYINTYYKACVDKFNSFSSLDGFADCFTIEQANRYRELLEMKKNALLGCVGENHIWDWSGGSSLLMTGVIPIKKGSK